MKNVAIFRVASYRDNDIADDGRSVAPLALTEVKENRNGVEGQAWADHIAPFLNGRLKVVRELYDGIYHDMFLLFPYSEKNVEQVRELFKKGQLVGFVLPASVTYVNPDSDDDDTYTAEFERVRAELDYYGIEWLEGASEHYNFRNADADVDFTDADVTELAKEARILETGRAD